MTTIFKARIAKPSDYKKIVRLCKRAVGPHDYVLSSLSDTIARKGLFLAFSGKELVGMSNFSLTLDNAGWLGMARTDPNWRRKGVAVFLQKTKSRYARKLGISKLRLFVLSTNTPSLRACIKGGFHPVAESAHLSLRLRGSHTKEFSFRKTTDMKSLDGLRSRYVSKLNGYVGYKWNFLKLDKSVLSKLIASGELYECGGVKFILSEKIEHEEGAHREFSLLEGSFEKGIASVISVARKLRTDSLGTFIPYEHYLISIARSLGFKDDSWGWHCIALEKKI